MNRAKAHLLTERLVDTLGAQHFAFFDGDFGAVAEALEALRQSDAEVLLSSTLTLGTRQGTLFERDISELPHPRARRGQTFDLAEEIQRLHARLERVAQGVDHAQNQSERRTRALAQLEKNREPQSALPEVMELFRGQALKSETQKALALLGKRYGLQNADAYMHWLFEHVFRSVKPQGTIVRLAPLGASVSGKTRGLSLPFAQVARKGGVTLRHDDVIDLVPFDHAQKALESLLQVRASSDTAPKVLHLSSADRSPLSGDRFLELLDLHLKARSHSPLAKSRAGFAPKALQYPALYDEGTRMRAKNIERVAGRKFWSEEGAIDWRRYLLDVHFPEAARAPLQKVEVAQSRLAYPTLVHLLEQSADRHPRAFAFKHLYKDVDKTALTLRYDEVLDRAHAVAQRLHDAGVRTGDRVFLCGKNHPFWNVGFFGIILSGAVCVPLDPALTKEALGLIRKSAEPHCALMGPLPEPLPGTAAPEGQSAQEIFDEGLADLHTMSLSLVTTPGPKGARFDISQNNESISGESLASILYTSGTTGVPKGVMLSHQNFTSLLASLSSIFEMHDDERLLSVLPLHHTFEFSAGFLLPFMAGGCINTLEVIEGEALLRALQQEAITTMVGVPALWQLLQRRIENRANETQTKAQLFSLLRKTNTILKRHLPEDSRVQKRLESLLFTQVHQALGGQMRTLISGGSALAPETAALFNDVGLPLAEGYGLTEAAPVLTVATHKDPEGSVGKSIPGVQLKIEDADEQGRGEVWAKGANIMRGYYKNAEATAGVLKDGWLRTGDLGLISKKGILTLTGRMKDVVVSASGENIYLDDTETLIARELQKNDIGPEKFNDEDAEFTLVGDMRGSQEELVLVYVGDEALGQRLKRACKSLPIFARPRAILAYNDETLPKTSTRKVKRKSVQGFVRSERERAQVSEQSATLRVIDSRALRAVRDVMPKATVTLQTRFDDLGFDSLMWIELQSVLEKNESRTFDALVLAELTSVKDLAELFETPEEKESAPSERLAAPQNDNKTPLSETVVSALLRPLRQNLANTQNGIFEELFETEVFGAHFIPQNEPVIVIANHTSHLDTGLIKFALGPYGEKLRALAAKDYFFEGNPIKTGFFKNLTNLAPIDRKSGSGRAFEQAKELVDQGEVLLIFPEGTRQTSGELAEFKPLVARLAMETGRAVLPLHLTGAYEALPKGGRRLKARELKVKIGAPISAQELFEYTQNIEGAPQKARVATELLHAAVASLGGIRLAQAPKSAEESLA